MNRDKLKSILQASYKREDWRNVLAFLSGNKDLLKQRLEPRKIELQTQKASKIVKKLYELGTLTTSDGVQLPIFEIELQENIKIEYNKVGVNQLIKDYILKDAGKGAIATYHYTDEKLNEWRFSFISKFGGSEFFDEVEDVETNPKKFTYIFGTREEHRTALERLYNLEQSRFTLEDFFEAFNVEPVSNNFFKEYKNFFLDFVNHLSTNDECRKIFENEHTEDVEKDIRNFVKRLLGRIVFLYFLQKKRWLGASNTNYEDGDTNFLLHLFEAHKPQFYNQWLSKLFFNALNTPDRPDDNFEMPDGQNRYIPFLNGGLFEENQEPKHHKSLHFPEYLFEELFAFFNGYNFTIYENSPDDHTVAVDPEMLGNIFENLLEDNNDKGTFYTPKEIVHYMTQESLIEYINTHLKDKTKTEIENLVKNQILDNITQQDLLTIVGLLDKVKICDPAIGSGAFPMGMLQEIFSLKAFIHYELGYKDWQPAEIKQNIIQNSIYGVDLEEGAVDIARLRFWLSLVVDEDKPQPLPNLDYKIMQGNSLLESFEGIPLNNADLFNEPTHVTLFEEPEDYGLRDDIKKLMEDYYNPQNYNQKQNIHNAIDRKVINYIDKCLEGYENQKLIELAGARQTLARKTELKQNTKSIIKECNQIQNLIESKGYARKKLIEFEQKSERPYFLWSLFFQNVLEQGGFDIVIGNPPYKQLQKMKKDADLLKDEGYKTYSQSGDIYCLFYEKAGGLLKQHGILSYITSNSWIKTKYGKSLRKYLIAEMNPLKLLNFEDTQIFPSATVEVNILIAKKESWDEKINIAVLDEGFGPNMSISDFYNKNHFQLRDLSEEGWIILNNTQQKIIGLLLENTVPLKEKNVKIRIGIINGFNEAFIIDSRTRQTILNDYDKGEEIIKPLLLGKNLSKYSYRWDDKWLINTHNGIKDLNVPRIKVKDDYPGIYEHLLKYKSSLEIRKNKGDHWTNLRNCGYFLEFEEPKILWGELSDKPKFVYEDKGMYADATLFSMTGDNLKELVAILNSKLALWYFQLITTTSGMGTNRWKKYKIEQMPVPLIIRDRTLEQLVDIIQYVSSNKTHLNEDIKNEYIAQFFEEIIDGCVFEIYFKEHMYEKGINIKGLVQQQIANVFKESNLNILEELHKKQKIWMLYQNLKKSEVQQRMRLFVSKSPEILKIILQS